MRQRSPRLTPRTWPRAIVGWMALGVLGAVLSRTTLAADLRLAASGYLDGLGVIGTEQGRQQDPALLGELRVDGALGRRWAGRLTLRGRVGGPFQEVDPGLFNFVHAFQSLSPSLDVNEGYVDLRLPRADFRVGVQKFAWGKLDGIPPTDVLNPRDFHDPFVREVEDAKLGIPAARVTYFFEDLPRLALSGVRATFIYVPIAVPSRLPLPDERWFPTSALLDEPVRVPRGRVERALERVLGVSVALRHDVVIPVSLHTRNRRPPAQLDAGGIAVQLGGTWRDIDWDLSHYSGPETGPDADLPATLFLEQLAVDPDLNVDLQLRARGDLRQVHDTIHMTGGDVALAVAGGTVRAEAAVFQDRPYLRVGRDLVSPQALARLPLQSIARQLLRQRRAAVPLDDLFVDRDSVEWGVGADYLVQGAFALLQVNQIILFESAPRLLIAQPDTRLTLLIRRSFLRERLEGELRTAYSLERGAWFAFPRISYAFNDNLRARLGYLIVAGASDSVIGQFRPNDEVVLQLRYTF